MEASTITPKRVAPARPKVIVLAHPSPVLVRTRIEEKGEGKESHSMTSGRVPRQRRTTRHQLCKHWLNAIPMKPWATGSFVSALVQLVGTSSLIIHHLWLIWFVLMVLKFRGSMILVLPPLLCTSISLKNYGGEGSFGNPNCILSRRSRSSMATVSLKRLILMLILKFAYLGPVLVVFRCS